MDGPTLVRIVNSECQKRGMSKAEFYKEIGISSASFTGWKQGSVPSRKYVEAIERLFGIDLSEYDAPNETDELREVLRERQDLRILLKSAKDAPPSSVYALISQIEKIKEDAK